MSVFSGDADTNSMHALRFLPVSERKRTEAALRSSEKRYRDIVETTHEGVWMIDVDQRTVFVNRPMAEMLGYVEAEMLGTSLWDFFDEEWTAKTAAMFREKPPGQRGQVEMKYRRKDGSDLWGLLSTSEVLDDDGNQQGALAMVTDITERKKAEQEAHKSRERLAAAQAMAHIGSWEWEVADDDITWSDELYRIFGVRRDEFEVTDESYLWHIHPDDRARARQTVQLAMKTKQPYKHELRIVRPDGAVRVIESRAEVITAANGELVRLVGTAQDMTDHKHSEQELARRAKQQAAIATLGREALSGPDLMSLMRSALKTTKDTLSVDLARVLELEPDGQGFTLRAASGPVPPAGASPVDNESQANYTLGAGSPVLVEDLATETRFNCVSLIQDYGAVSGMSVPVENGGSPFGVLSVHTTIRRRFTDEDAEFLEAVAYVLGVAIARQRAEQVEVQLQTAQRLESIGQLAGGIAHDFNNLLSVILNYARFAIDELEDRSSVREDIEEIKKAAERAAGLTHQLLVFSRREVTETEVVNMNEVVADARTLLMRTLGEHTEMESTLEPDLWPVRVGVGQIEQVLINLAVNAHDAMPDGGKLEIKTENVELDTAASRGEWSVPAGRYALLTVRDTGCGMDQEIATRAFEPFFTTKPIGSGTGLGLATVYGIAKQAGGYADICSEPKQGTALKIYLPRSEGPSAPRRLVP